MGARRVALAAVGAAIVLICPSPAAGATAATATAAGATAATATADVAADVAARVTRLTADYRRHSSAAAAAAADLSAAYAGLETADQAADATAVRAAQARSDRTALAVDLYVNGTATGGGLTLLTAGSPEDALWRLAVGSPLAERLMADAVRADDTADAVADDDVALATRARRAADDLAVALDRLRDEQEAARLTLAQARAELSRLDAAERRERAAQQAAAALANAQHDAAAARFASSTPVTALGIPSAFEQAYRTAAQTCSGLDWTLLAAVGQVESGHGRNNGPSSAGAIGPMQFMPATFAQYGVDGDGDGVRSAWDPEDAVFAAARYLCASGAGEGPAGVRRALFAYNHAQWYVDLVLATQRAILARG